MFVGKTIDWKISCLRSVLSPQFATAPSCAYAWCQSEKVQMLLVPGGLVSRLHRLSPSCYTFCLAPPSRRLTVCACGRSSRCYIWGTKLWHVTLISLTVLDAMYVFGALLVKISSIFTFSTVYNTPLAPVAAGPSHRVGSGVVYTPRIWSRVLPPGRYSMWWLSGPHWASPVHQWITVHDSTALSHFLCFDMNRKERIPAVVNTDAAMPHPPLSAPFTSCFIPLLSRSRYNGLTTKWSKMLHHKLPGDDTCSRRIRALYLYCYYCLCQNIFYLPLDCCLKV